VAIPFRRAVVFGNVIKNRLPCLIDCLAVIAQSCGDIATAELVTHGVDLSGPLAFGTDGKICRLSGKILLGLSACGTTGPGSLRVNILIHFLKEDICLFVRCILAQTVPLKEGSQFRVHEVFLMLGRGLAFVCPCLCQFIRPDRTDA